MKHYFLLNILFFLYYFSIPTVALICYSCTTTLNSNVEENAKIALRIFLNSVYELPPVSRFCNMEDDIEFKTIPTIQCSTANDQCVKVKAENDGLEFVIRGCRSRIYKADVSIPQNIQCRSGSPSLCFCKENFCNSTNKINASIFTVAIIIFLYFVF
ncbi:hypothetical protein Mgra_00003914 [Meloidogyne graminicola]|uniref:Protein sleepless n=1 Tax=Meloidogyne graminicola TaxID=189291 RepID=A0A8S9ZSS3_9BILA|nr:hypothetical protein Mgra_00003914 [Meloidogyne graminicola]